MTLVGVYLTKAWSAVVVLTFALVNHLDQRQSVGQSLALALPRDSEDKKKRHWCGNSGNSGNSGSPGNSGNPGKSG